jgi:hypothetical protein
MSRVPRDKHRKKNKNKKESRLTTIDRSAQGHRECTKCKASNIMGKIREFQTCSKIVGETKVIQSPVTSRKPVTTGCESVVLLSRLRSWRFICNWPKHEPQSWRLVPPHPASLWCFHLTVHARSHENRHKYHYITAYNPISLFGHCSAGLRMLLISRYPPAHITVLEQKNWIEVSSTGKNIQQAGFPDGHPL